MKMENNQEHKIDKIFRKSLENQSVVPPTDTWMGIQTYTIGQGESKKRFWVKYVILASLFLIFVGFGLWYFANNQDVIVKNNTELQLKKLLVDNGEKSSVKTQTTADAVKLSMETRTTTQEIKPTTQVLADNGERLSIKTQITTESSVEIQPTTQLLADNGERLSTETKTATQDNLTNRNIELIEPVSYLTDDKVKIIKSKPLILNNLIDKIKNENENKIVALEGDNIDKKEIYKPDTADYGNKFSLRHPIISYGLGFSWNNWDMNDYYYFNNFTNQTTKGVVIKVGVAWKLSKKVRLALGFKINSLGNIDINYTIPPQSARLGGSTLTLTQMNSDFFYNELTPFGNVNIPASLFKDWYANQPSQPNLISNVFYTSPHSIRTFQTDINIEYDLSSYKRKNGFYYQFYVIGGMNVQRQTIYSYNVTNILYRSSSGTPAPTSSIPRVFFEDSHLQNGAEFIFGANLGLGLRWQFAKKWSLNLETIGQTSLNSWVENLPYTTKQTMFSLQGGIQLNL